MAIHPRTIYTKTPKGVMEAKKLDRTAGSVFLTVDGKSTVTDLLKKSGLDEKKLHELLEKLTTDGYLRVFSSPEAAPAAAGKPGAATVPGQAAASEDDFDFTTPQAMASLSAEAEKRAKAEAEAKARALAAARAAAEAKVRQEADARARAQ